MKGSEFSNDIPKNYVFFQDPDPGTEIKKGRDVKIIISKGMSTVLVPNLQGRSNQQSRIIFEENDLHQGQISRIYHDSIEKDDVIAQFPNPGSKVKKGRHIDLLVSLGMRQPNTFRFEEFQQRPLPLLPVVQIIIQVGQVSSTGERGYRRQRFLEASHGGLRVVLRVVTPCQRVEGRWIFLQLGFPPLGPPAWDPRGSEWPCGS